MNRTFDKINQAILTITSYLGLTLLVILTLFIVSASIFRTSGHGIIGDIEIIELLMCVLIFFGIPYAQTLDGHIKIGILVDRLSARVQELMNAIGHLLTFVIAAAISIVYYKASVKALFVMEHRSFLLQIPYSPVKVIICIFAALWALICIFQFIQSVQKFTGYKTGASKASADANADANEVTP